ncbi:MAG: tRNA (guanosine(37)-N1)-methyltransferase TrmD [Gammaproteobacteria bacterium]|nr:tRNA (guanosine(37)-N1)-methyltransferase TrmD [Gammaproteobacteria bacterium]
MRFDVVTLFPELVQGLVGKGVTGRAFVKGRAELTLWNPRDYTQDVHRTVDDRPYGGGPGMVMKIEPLVAAIEAARQASPQAQVIYLGPQGRQFNQSVAGELKDRDGLILVAGRYEGIDERVFGRCIDDEISIGDYVLSGGELAALVVVDTVVRLLPGVLGDADSALQDSYMEGLLDCPHYTRPECYEGERVPPVLLSGDHSAIARWRLQQSLGRTWLRRPDLLQGRRLSDDEQNLLDEFIRACVDAG